MSAKILTNSNTLAQSPALTGWPPRALPVRRPQCRHRTPFHPAHRAWICQWWAVPWRTSGRGAARPDQPAGPVGGCWTAWAAQIPWLYGACSINMWILTASHGYCAWTNGNGLRGRGPRTAVAVGGRVPETSDEDNERIHTRVPVRHGAHVSVLWW